MLEWAALSCNSPLTDKPGIINIFDLAPAAKMRAQECVYFLGEDEELPGRDSDHGLPLWLCLLTYDRVG